MRGEKNSSKFPAEEKQKCLEHNKFAVLTAIRANTVASARKDNIMDEMTDRQFEESRETLILLILEMMKNSKDLKEANEKVKALLNKE